VPEKKLIDECVHCGFCLQACPTYQSWGEEMDSPRGRIYLMKGIQQGSIPLSEAAVVHFDKCLGCMSCVTACPSGVKYGTLIEQMRAEVEQQYSRSLGDRLFRFMLFALLPYPRRLKLIRFLQNLYKWSGLQWLVRASGILERLSPRIAQLDRLMPPGRKGALGASLPQLTPAQGSQRATVGLLTGCVQSVYFSDVNSATVRVLSAEGCEVRVPPDQPCCGALSLHAGREKEAKEFTRALIKRFDLDALDALIVNAAGCGSHLKECARLFEDDPVWHSRALAFASKVRDATEFLAQLGPAAPRRGLPQRLRVAYHDACHLAHAQGIREQPRSLLRGIPNLELLEIPEPEQCCGSAGIYNLVEPQSAREIGDRKVDNLLSTGAQLMATANPGCALQIQSLLRERGKTLPCLHPVQLVDASLRGQAPV
jgi:glycolate oxidase iron-sulfur subunit